MSLVNIIYPQIHCRPWITSEERGKEQFWPPKVSCISIIIYRLLPWMLFWQGDQYIFFSPSTLLLYTHELLGLNKMAIGRSAEDERLRELIAKRDFTEAKWGHFKGLIIGQTNDLRMLGRGHLVESMAVKVADKGGLKRHVCIDHLNSIFTAPICSY